MLRDAFVGGIQRYISLSCNFKNSTAKILWGNGQVTSLKNGTKPLDLLPTVWFLWLLRQITPKPNGLKQNKLIILPSCVLDSWCWSPRANMKCWQGRCLPGVLGNAPSFSNAHIIAYIMAPGPSLHLQCQEGRANLSYRGLLSPPLTLSSSSTSGFPV